eukprot:3575147-Prymnesium_polylepis.1
MARWRLSARVGGTCRTCQRRAERIRVLAYFLARSVALVSRYRTRVLHWAIADGRSAEGYGGVSAH